jgi:hypothetical protein
VHDARRLRPVRVDAQAESRRAVHPERTPLRNRGRLRPRDSN